MKIATRGFTLVELMIVIAIIGVLAAALFPAMSGYLARARDTARISHVGQIITAAASSFQDKNSYDQVMLTGASTAGCVSSGALDQYMGGQTPIDKAKRNHCNTATNGPYGAGTGDTYGSKSIVISASLESAAMGNTGWALTSFQTGSQVVNVYGNFNKGSGSGYVISR